MTPLDLERGLARLGYASFRPGQREAILTLLETGRLLLVAPTGGGKSLIYQLPATLLPGTTLVISPLVSLMHDQVQALEARGVAATFLAATLSAEEMRERLKRAARRGASSSPTSPRSASPIRVSAHWCAIWTSRSSPSTRPTASANGATTSGPTTWRSAPSSRSCGLPRVLACTATATPVVRDEILARLGLAADTPQLAARLRPAEPRAARARGRDRARARPRGGRPARRGARRRRAPGAARPSCTLRPARLDGGGGDAAGGPRLARRRPTTRG